MFHNVKILFFFIVLSIKRKLNAWNTQQRLAILKKKKKTYNTEIEEEKTYDTEIETEGKKKLYDTDIDHHPFPH